METRPALLNDVDAARYLLLADDAPNDKAAVKRLNRIVDSGRIRPCIIGKRRRYSVVELDRFIAAETDRYAETH